MTFTTQFKNLVASILNLTIKDSREEEYKKDVELFIEGEWCEELCDFVNVDYVKYADMCANMCVGDKEDV